MNLIIISPSLHLEVTQDGELFAVHVSSGLRLPVPRKALESWLLRLIRSAIK